MTARLIDYSFARPGGAAIKAAGFSGCLRYVPYLGDQGKGLSGSEVTDLRAHGLAIGLVFESVAERHLAGFTAGTMDATISLRALDNLGFPSNAAVYFAVDFDAQPAEMLAIDNYQRGAASVLGAERVGVYGSYAVVEHCHNAGTAAWFWMTYAWSGGRKPPAYAHLFQYSNGETVGEAAVDYNEAYGAEQGLWKSEEDELTAEEKAELAALRTIVGGKDADGHDLLLAVNGLNDAINKHIVGHGGGPPVNVKQIYDDVAAVLKTASGAMTQAGIVRAGVKS